MVALLLSLVQFLPTWHKHHICLERRRRMLGIIPFVPTQIICLWLLPCHYLFFGWWVRTVWYLGWAAAWFVR